MRVKRTYDIIITGLMAAIIAVCSWVTIPFSTVPFTMQTFAVFVAALMLGSFKGTVAVIIYLITGIAGLPVFSAFQAGPGVLAGATGGFLTGFVFITLIGGFFERKFRNDIISFFGLIVGLICCYTTGALWYAYVYLDSQSIMTILTACVLPYIIPDFIKCALAVVVVKKLRILQKDV